MRSNHIPKAERKKILLLCDDLRMNSGIATMAREFVTNLAHRYNWFQLGAALKHPEVGKVFDLSKAVNDRIGIDDADVKVMPNNGYGNSTQIRQIMREQKPDAIYIFTDPRYWVWLFEIEREIRTEIPIFWLNIWDDYPAPMYNKNFYDSVDLLMGISKQTVNINKLVLGDKAKDKVIEYVPHGIDEKTFFPITADSPLYPQLQEFKSKTIPVATDFIVYFNSRNIHRKRPGDVMLAYKLFCDKIGAESKRTALVMHTEASNPHGTDLRACKAALCPDENVFFSEAKITPEQMNFMYNMADVTMLISSNEGWGLSLTESMMCGTMIIGAVTGGMQDQMRFTDKKGNWIDFTADFPSNHRGTYKNCGEWAVPVFPSNISLAGSPQTPYIFDDRVSPEDAADALYRVYKMLPSERVSKGLKGHEWVTSDESNMSSLNMCNRIDECMQKAFEEFVPRERFEVIKVEDSDDKVVKHKLIGY